MKRFVVKISTAITVDAEDENEAPQIAVQLCDFGSFDYEVHTEEEWEEVELTDTYEEVSSNGKTTGSKPVDVGSIPTTSAKQRRKIWLHLKILSKNTDSLSTWREDLI